MRNEMEKLAGAIDGDHEKELEFYSKYIGWKAIERFELGFLSVLIYFSKFNLTVTEKNGLEGH